MSNRHSRKNHKKVAENEKQQNWGNHANVVSIFHEGSISLDSLVKGTKHYIKYMSIFLRQPFSFIRNIDYKDVHVLKNAFIFFCYSVTLLYLILLPVFVYEGHGIHRITFYLRTLIQGGFTILGLHLGIKMIGGKGDIKQTLSATLFSSGFITPISSIFLLPAYFALGTDFIFGGANYIIARFAGNERAEIYWLLYFNLISGLGGVIFFIHYLKFSNVIHKINWVQSILAYIIGMAIALPALIWVVNPALSKVFPYIENAIDYIL